MATVVKDFKVKAGLVVEGANATVGGYDVLKRENESDEAYIIGLVTGGGGSDSDNTPNTVVLRDGTGSFAAGTITAEVKFVGDLEGDVTGNVTGDITGNVTGNLTGNVTGNLTGNVTGNVAGNLTGNADTATALQTPRTIAGQTFDGTQNVVIAPTDLDGVTATAAELNILNGATIDTTELNYLDGVTSSVQTQLDDLVDAIDAIEADTGLADHIADTSTHGVAGDIVGTTDTQTISNKTLGSDLAAGGYKVTGLGAPTNDNDAATKKYVDDEIADIVGTMPAILDTIGELADALQDNPDVIDNLQTLAAGKQDALTAGANINIDNDTDVISVTGLMSTDIGDFATAAQTAGTGYFDSIGSAQDVADDLSAHEGLSSGVHGVTGNIVGTSDAQTLTSKTIDGNSNTISNIANASLVNDSVTVNGNEVELGNSITLDTDDIGEGTAQYFTEERAVDAIASAIAGGTQTNISVSYNGATNKFDFVAENGVADSTTNDLVEGTGPGANLYFTDARAVAALEAVVPNFTEIDINSVATQVAAASSGDAAQSVVAYQFSADDYKSAKFLVKVAYGTHTEVSEVLLTLDSSNNIAITEYAVVGTNGSASAISADVSGGNVRLLVTPTNNSSTIKVMGTLLV